MPFDDRKYYAPASHGDIGGIALRASRGLAETKWALEAIARKLEVDISEELTNIEQAYRELDQIFDDLTGFTPSA